MRLSDLPPFPQSLEIANERRLPHSHRTTTTTHYDDNLALQKRRRFSFAATIPPRIVISTEAVNSPIVNRGAEKSASLPHPALAATSHFLFFFKQEESGAKG